jgi:hypothetical protein
MYSNYRDKPVAAVLVLALVLLVLVLGLEWHQEGEVIHPTNNRLYSHHTHTHHTKLIRKHPSWNNLRNILSSRKHN